MKKPILIVIDGTDGSGKETQVDLSVKNMEKKGLKVVKLSFPNYDSRACAPVKAYLNGDYGADASKINPYGVSMMYSIDRFASYTQDWHKSMEEADVIIADRYTTSNIFHQGSKLKSEREFFKYVEWLEHTEYDLMGLPRPDMILFLDMHPEVSIQLRKERNAEGDLHENDSTHIWDAYKRASSCCKLLGWERINCYKKEIVNEEDPHDVEVSPRSISLIQQFILDRIQTRMNELNKII